MTKKQLSIWADANPLVKMHHPLVFAQFGYVELTTMRLFLLMLAKWDMDAPIGTPIRVPISDIIKNYEGDGGAQFDQLAMCLQEMTFKMRNVNVEHIIKGKRTYTVMTVIDYLKYIEGTDYIEGAFGGKIQEYLRELKGRFTLAELNEVFAFKSSYAIKLFMIGKTFYPGGFNELRFSVPELRKILGCESPSYDKYKVFKQKILMPNLYALLPTSAAIDMHEDKQGTKSVKYIIITPFSEKVSKASPISEQLLINLKKLKITTTKIVKLIEKKEIDEAYISFCIKVVQENLMKSNNIEKPAAIMHDYIVKKTLYAQYLETLPKVYKAPIKAKAIPAFLTTFRPYSELQEIHHTNYDETIQAMVADGFFPTEKNGVQGLGKY